MKMKKPLGYNDYTVVLTYVGMLCAIIAIFLSINMNYLDAVIFLMLSGVCDMFDGTIAATKNRNANEKRFGIQIDSLSDLISFGVMPAVFVYMITDKSLASGIISALFVLSALIRLAYFNVNEEERQQNTSEKRKVFQGMPVTSMAILLPVVFLMESGDGNHLRLPYLGLLLLGGMLFLTPFEIKKPNLVGKICLIVVGVLELLGIVFMGWDLV